jgi:organic hydroperoxide reductase OsmC/OhrA
VTTTGIDQRFTVELTLRDGYEFAVNFEQVGVPPLFVDEPPPLGAGRGPNPARLLAAAVGSCLSTSLLFCLRKAHVDVEHLHTTVEGTLARNAGGRLRISDIRVRLAPQVAPQDRARMGRCLELYEDFCIVTESVRAGIAVDVQVEGAPAKAAPALA